MEEAKKAEEAVRDQILIAKIQIAKLTDQLKQYETDLQLRVENSRKYQEEAFEKAYGHSAQKIRDDYVKLVTACCYCGGDGYAVNVPGTNPSRHPHWILRPEKRAVCAPTPLVKEAFEMIGVDVSIANTTHIEMWGN